MIIKRDLYLNQLVDKRKNGMIKVITGLRRSGKSFLLNNLYLNYLLSIGISDDHIIRFAFDTDEDIDLLDNILPEEKTRLDNGLVNSKKFRTFVNSKIKDDKDYYLLLDEIQNLDNFIGTLNGFLRHENFDVYVTGSNSRMLSSDIVTEFRGRGDEISVNPLSFKEYYSTVCGNFSFDDAWNEYITYGGMPLSVDRSEIEKQKYLKKLFNETYLKDIIERNGVRDDEELEEVLNIISSSIGSLTNPKKLSDYFKSNKQKSISPVTIKKYLDFLEDAFVIRKSMRYDIKGKKYINTPYKYYFSDIGLRNARLNFRQIEENHIMENIIYNELFIRGYSIDVGVVEINEKQSNGSYFRKQLECDFVVNLGDQKFYIQSALHIENDEKRKQETQSLINIPDSFKKIIIVRDNIKSNIDENGIITVSLKDFLLDNSLLK